MLDGAAQVGHPPGVFEAAVFSLTASAALVVGSGVGAVVEVPKRVLAFLLAFASGALTTAMAFELYHGAVRRSDTIRAAAAFVAGAAVFIAVDWWLMRRVSATNAKGATRKVAGFALLAAVTLDGVPGEPRARRLARRRPRSFALLLAIFASNLPESLVGSAQTRTRAGHRCSRS